MIHINIKEPNVNWNNRVSISVIKSIFVGVFRKTMRPSSINTMDQILNASVMRILQLAPMYDRLLPLLYFPIRFIEMFIWNPRIDTYFV